MKIAVVSESSADEAAVWLIVTRILGSSAQRAQHPPLRTRGWPSVKKELPAIIKHLHYQTDCEHAVVVIDSNGSPNHLADGNHVPSGSDEHCRLCQLQIIVGQTSHHLRSVAGKERIKVALGLAVPSIEAWCLASSDHKISEAAWQSALWTSTFPYDTRGLKLQAYGTDRPSLAQETEIAIKLMGESAAGINLLRSRFSGGFGFLYDEIASWRQ